MKKLNKAAKAGIISASVIAAPLIGLFTFRAVQNLKVRIYFEELYPDAEVTEIKETEHAGMFGSRTYTKKVTLYDKEHGFYFDQVFYYEGLKTLPLDDANAVWRERYLKTAVSCENIVNAIPECYNGEYFTRYSVGSGVFTDGMFIFLKQPPADEFEGLVERLSAASAENYTGENQCACDGFIESTVIILPPDFYELMSKVDFSEVYESKNTSNWIKGDYEEYIDRMFKKSLSVSAIPMYKKDNDYPLSKFYDGSLDETSILCAELYPIKEYNRFLYFDLI